MWGNFLTHIGVHHTTRWMMNKAKITSQLLMDYAAAYYLNKKNTSQWKTEISRNTQIIALTT
jgi:hypothetical protein